MAGLQNIKEHPCFRARSAGGDGRLSHRSGGFGGTCERCGTEIDGPNNAPINAIVSWRAIRRPEPYQPGSLNEAIFKITHSVVKTDEIAVLIAALQSQAPPSPVEQKEG